jgi:hypothetical protein
VVEAVPPTGRDRDARLIAAGSVRPVIDRTYPLDDIVAALKRVNDGDARGKVIVTMPDGASGPMGGAAAPSDLMRA